MSCEPCPIGGTQVGPGDPHGAGVTCPGCGRSLTVPSPSPPGTWPEHRARWPEHTRLAHLSPNTGKPQARRGPKPSTPVEQDGGAFAAGWAVGEVMDFPGL